MDKNRSKMAMQNQQDLFYNFETDGDDSDCGDDYPMKSSKEKENDSSSNDGFWFGKNK